MKNVYTYLRFGLLGIMFSVVSVHNLAAQSNCSQLLVEATRKFEMGQLNEIPELLSSCLRNGFTKDENVQAYRLLTLVHLYLDDKTSAEKSFLNMLVINKEYVVDLKSDPSELVYLAEMYRIRPILSLHVKAGNNLTVPKVINRYAIGDNLTNIENYNYTPGFKFSAAIEYPLLKYIQIGVESSFSLVSFTYNNRVNNFADISLKESQSWLDFPVYIKGAYSFGKFTPYVYGGGAYSLLLSNSAEEPSRKTDETNTTGKTIDILELRKGYNISLIGGAGLKIKQGLNYIVIDFRYSRGISNVVDKSTRYDNSLTSGNELMYRYWYVDPDYALNQYALTVGFVKSIYKPKKLKK